MMIMIAVAEIIIKILIIKFEEKHKYLTVLSIHPGIVDTNMQYEIRKSDKQYFPLLDQFITYYNDGKLENIQDIAKKIYYILQNKDKFTLNIIS